MEFSRIQNTLLHATDSFYFIFASDTAYLAIYRFFCYNTPKVVKI